MASSSSSKAVATIALLLSLNLMFFTMASATHLGPCSPPPRTPKHPSLAAPYPKDTLKLGVCANLLKDMVHLVIDSPAKIPCYPLIEGLADLVAAACLCSALKANVLGINLNVSKSLSLLLNYCGKGVPSGFQCA